MYLLNTTFIVEPAILETWNGIIKTDYIPLLERRGYEVVAFSRVISAEAVDHFTFSLLVSLPDMAKYKELTEDIFPEYIEIADPLFGSRALWFSTLMKKME